MQKHIHVPAHRDKSSSEHGHAINGEFVLISHLLPCSLRSQSILKSLKYLVPSSHISLSSVLLSVRTK